MFLVVRPLQAVEAAHLGWHSRRAPRHNRTINVTISNNETGKITTNGVVLHTHENARQSEYIKT